MRLSDKMILGTALKRHVRWCVIPAEGSDSGCAMQLAAAAVGMRNYTDMIPAGFWLTELRLPCPACRHFDDPITIITFHLNDKHGWNIERIADWVRSVEPAEPEQLSVDQNWFDEVPAETVNAK